MSFSDVSCYVTLLDTNKVKAALLANPGDLNSTDKNGATLLHYLASDYDEEETELLPKFEAMLKLLFDSGVNPTMRTYTGDRTAKEFARHIGQPQALIDKLAKYEAEWELKHSGTATSAPTSHCRRRYQADVTPAGNGLSPAYTHQVHTLS